MARRMAAAWLSAMTAFALLSAFVGLGSAQECAIADPIRPGNVYDLTPLIDNTQDYTVVYELVAMYTFQFCRALVQPISPAACPITDTMVCERYLNTYRAVGKRPSMLQVLGDGELRITYTRGYTYVAQVDLYCDRDYVDAPLLNVTSISGYGLTRAPSVRNTRGRG